MTNGNDCAHPVEQRLDNVGSLGLTKREYFAAMAMHALLADAETARQFETSPIGIPQTAVIAADALIEALNK